MIVARLEFSSNMAVLSTETGEPSEATNPEFAWYRDHGKPSENFWIVTLRRVSCLDDMHVRICLIDVDTVSVVDVLEEAEVRNPLFAYSRKGYFQLLRPPARLKLNSNITRFYFRANKVGCFDLRFEDGRGNYCQLPFFIEVRSKLLTALNKSVKTKNGVVVYDEKQEDTLEMRRKDIEEIWKRSGEEHELDYVLKMQKFPQDMVFSSVV